MIAMPQATAALYIKKVTKYQVTKVTKSHVKFFRFSKKFPLYVCTAFLLLFARKFFNFAPAKLASDFWAEFFWLFATDSTDSCPVSQTDRNKSIHM